MEQQRLQGYPERKCDKPTSRARTLVQKTKKVIENHKERQSCKTE